MADEKNEMAKLSSIKPDALAKPDGRRPKDRVRNYEDIKEAARRRSAEASASGRDIGPVPKVADAKRRESCRLNLPLFLKTYFPVKFELEWSSNHLLIIEKIERAALHGGLCAMAMPRASGKTSICERAALWAVAYGHRRFVALIGATEEAAIQNLDEIKMEIETNETFIADFPEISFPVCKLDGIANRANGQTCCGERTRITWTDREVVLPTIAKSAASGAVIQVRGITGRLRGMKAATASGESLRPDLVLIDDPQTDESAASPEQNRKRIRILDGTILGLAGPNRKIAGVMPCTVIRPDDMADEILDRDKHPEWNGERHKLLESLPQNMDLWDRYAEIWGDSQRKKGDISDATEFYRAHRSEMDAGAVSAWPARYLPDEISAVQYAMNIYVRSRETFFAEYQNEPLPDEAEEAEKLEPDLFRQRLNRRRRGEVPQDATKLTMFIDVQKSVLYYMVCAFNEKFSVSVIDYGTFPDQKRRYFTLGDVRRTLQKLLPGAGLEGAIYGGLKQLTSDYLAREFPRESGGALRIDRCFIDSAWGETTNVVYSLCRESEFSAILLPSRGKGITAGRKPIAEYSRKPGDRFGDNWYITAPSQTRAVKLMQYDANFWKSFFRVRVLTSPGDAGSFSIYGSDYEPHRMLSEQLSSEYSIPTTGNERRVDEWNLIPGRDNHLLDCAVGCMVAASEQGIALEAGRGATKRRTVKFSDMQRNRSGGRLQSK